MAGASGRQHLVIDLCQATAYNDDKNAQNNWGYNFFDGFITGASSDLLTPAA
jgi:hypothetical protein